jgi:hypothetical protein
MMDEKSKIHRKHLDNIKTTDKTSVSAVASNDGLWPSFIGIDLATGPDRTAIQCGKCGWCGEPRDIEKIQACPECSNKQWISGP